MKKKIIAISLMVVGLVMILAALYLLVFTEVEESHAQQFSQNAVVQFTLAVSNQSFDVDGSEATMAASPSTAPSAESSATATEAVVTPSVTIDNRVYVGILEIPQLGLTLPVQDAWSYPKMLETPCVYSGSSADDSMIIIAHNYKVHFKYLTQLQTGAIVHFYDATGNKLSYSVTELTSVDQSNGSFLNEGQWDLTLVTCDTVTPTLRTVVRLSRIS